MKTSGIRTLVPASCSIHLSYTCLFWDGHIKRVAFNVNLFETVKLLFEKKFLFWLETLSVTSKMAIATSALLAVKVWLARAPPDVRSFLFHWVIIKFLKSEMTLGTREHFQGSGRGCLVCSEFWNALDSERPSHLYFLPFAPENSQISSLYASKFPNALSLQRGRSPHWPSLVMSIPIGACCVCCVAFSLDGENIASGLDDGVRKKWRTSSMGSKCTQMFSSSSERSTSIVLFKGGGGDEFNRMNLLAKFSQVEMECLQVPGEIYISPNIGYRVLHYNQNIHN